MTTRYHAGARPCGLTIAGLIGFAFTDGFEIAVGHVCQDGQIAQVMRPERTWCSEIRRMPRACSSVEYRHYRQ